MVGADGGGSSVARLAGAETLVQARHTTAVLFGYFTGIELSGYHWWFRPGIGAGVIPTNCGRHCVFVAIAPERLRNYPSRHNRFALFAELLRQADPALADRVAGTEPDEPLHVFGGRLGFLRQAFGPGWALVGDAGYFKDPLTAHGITDALRDAQLLADAVVDGTMARYAAIRHELSRPLFEVTDAIAGLNWDLEQIKVLHQALNEAMKREVTHLLTIGDTHAAMFVEGVL